MTDLKTINDLPRYDLYALQEKFGGKQVIFSQKNLSKIKNIISENGLKILKENLLNSYVYVPVKKNVGMDDDILSLLNFSFSRKEIVHILSLKYGLSERTIYYRIKKLSSF